MRAGLTLLEVLVITVLLAMVCSVMIISLGAADHAARGISTVGRLKDLDARGRLLAQTSGAQTAITLADDRVSLVANPRGSDPQLISEIELGDCAMRCETTGPETRITFDRIGHSADYQVELRWHDRTLRLHVCGLTGVFSSSEPHS